ncbi:unnamed protein product, partial [Phaeothamnion confervicola]
MAEECQRPEGWLHKATDGPVLQSLPGWSEHEAAMLWGTYRPSVYFGFKTRTAPAAVTAGLMWHGGDAPGPRYLRHDAREGEGVAAFGWREHDGRSYSRQVIVDTDNDIELTTSVVKPRALHAAAGDWKDNGVSFVSRVTVASTGGGGGDSNGDSAPVSTYLYFSIDCDGVVEPDQCLAAAGAPSRGVAAASRDGRVVIYGATSALGIFGIEISAHQLPEGGDIEGEGTSDRTATAAAAAGALLSYVGLAGVMAADAEQLLKELHANQQREAWRGKQEAGFELRNSVALGSNLVLVKVTAVPPFAVDIVVHEGANKDASAAAAAAAGMAAGRDSVLGTDGKPLEFEAVPAETVSEWLRVGKATFSARFERTFKLGERGFDDADVAAAKAALSNMLGGMGYFHGRSRIKGLAPGAGLGAAGDESLAASLFTAEPSRS